MISALTLADRSGVDVALLDTPNGRGCVSLSGLVGTPSVRSVRRVKPQARGGINPSRFTDGALMVGEFEAWSTVDVPTAFSRFRQMVKPMRETLTNGAALLKWTEGVKEKALDTNWITNPSFETGTADWATTGLGLVNGAVLTRDGTQPYRGTYSGKVTTTAVASQGVISANLGGGPFRQGTTYVATVRMRGDAGGESIDLRLGDLAADATGVTATLTTSWAEYRVSWVPTADRTAVNLLIRSNPATAYTFFVDAVGVFVGSTNAYFDGDSTNAQWNGAPHASTSTLYDRPVALKLQRRVKLESETDPILRGNAALLQWQAQFFAEDPRAYSQAQATFTGAALSTLGGGKIYNFTYPRTYASSGGGTLTATNNGTDDTPPVWRIYGYALNPQIVNLGTNERIVIAGTVAAGNYLEIDVFARTVKLNGTTELANLVNSPVTAWFDLPPGSTNLQMIASDFDAGARLDALVRDAY